MNSAWELIKAGFSAISDFLVGLFGEPIANVLKAIAIAIGAIAAAVKIYKVVAGIAAVVTKALGMTERDAKAMQGLYRQKRGRKKWNMKLSTRLRGMRALIRR